MASEKVTKILEDIKELSVMELFDLEKAIEEEFGVSAAAVAVAAPAGGAAGDAGAAEKTLAVLVLRKLRSSLSPLLRLSRKAFPRTRLRLSRRSSKRLALRSNSDNQNLLRCFKAAWPVFGRAVFSFSKRMFSSGILEKRKNRDILMFQRL